MENLSLPKGSNPSELTAKYYQRSGLLMGDKLFNSESVFSLNSSKITELDYLLEFHINQGSTTPFSMELSTNILLHPCIQCGQWVIGQEMVGRAWVSHTNSGKVNWQRPPGTGTSLLNSHEQVNPILSSHSTGIYKVQLAAVLGSGYTTVMMQCSRQTATHNSEAKTNKNILIEATT